MMEIPQTWEPKPLEVPAIFVAMAVKRLSDLGPTECGVIERVDTPEEVMALVQMGCCIGSSVKFVTWLQPTAPWPFARADGRCRSARKRRRTCGCVWLQIRRLWPDQDNKLWVSHART